MHWSLAYVCSTVNMFGGMNPAKIQGMMKKMGISQEELPVKRVIFELEDKNIVIEDPSVMRVKMQGQETYQVSGEAIEEDSSSFSEDDINMVMSKTKKNKEGAIKALESCGGDIAEAIMQLS